MNPLLNLNEFPDFAAILPEHFEPALDSLLTHNRTLHSTLVAIKDKTWDNFIVPLEQSEEALGQVWAIISHLDAIASTDAVREKHKNCLIKITQYQTELGQNEGLYQGYVAIQKSAEFASLNQAQQKLIKDALLDFRLSGVSLPKEQKAEYAKLAESLSELSNKFSNNVMDSTMAYHVPAASEAELSGLPEDIKQAAKELAQTKNQSGFLFSIDYPNFHAILTFADNAELRKAMYTAYVTRASDVGPTAGKFDNTPIMHEMLKTREALAHLLEFKNYAEYSLATKMAKTPEIVLNFLHELAAKGKPRAEQEKQALCDFAKSLGKTDELQSWDLSYYAEKLKERDYNFKQEEIKIYFELENVIQGLFSIVHDLFGLSFKEIKNVSVWDPAVKVFEVWDTKGKKGFLYCDLFVREHKRDGAWMHDGRQRTHLPGQALQLPLAFLNCNFQAPQGNAPSLLLHLDVETLFHEFGHCLQHLLTRIDYPSISGISGVEWDAVELASQFLENWCWQEESLLRFAKHYQTQAPMPKPLLDKMRKAKNFQSALGLVRQLEFSLFDFYLHLAPAKTVNVAAVLNETRKEVGVFFPPEFNRFPNSFSHIFGGGYGAGYYSYKWAEVLSADAFSLFEEKGLFDSETGERFKHYILEPGSSEPALELFTQFRGREPSIEPLLRHTLDLN